MTQTADMKAIHELKEHGVVIEFNRCGDKSDFKKTVVIPEMTLNRDFVLCSLVTYAENREYTACLDAFGITGINGMMWKRALRRKIDVTIAEVDAVNVAKIRDDVVKNELRINASPQLIVGKPVFEDFPYKKPELESTEKEDDKTSSDSLEYGINVTHIDANVMLNQRAFDFVFLNPCGSPVQYFDSAFRYTRHSGMMIITAMDLGTLYCKSPQLAERYYGAHATSTDYMREFAARIVLAAAARSAARFNKGISVMFCVTVKHGLTVCLRVHRSPSYADTCLKSVRKVIHCQRCQERAFYPDTNIPIENPYELLRCDCNKNGTGNYSVDLGPVWSGPIFSTQFLCDMKRTAETTATTFTGEFKSLVESLLVESRCSNSSSESAAKNDSSESPLREPPLKKTKFDAVEEDSCPPFYYNLTHRKLRKLIRVNKLVTHAQQEGFRCSRTHFDTNSVRSNASNAQLVALAEKYAPASK
ncbi:tRNA (guanine(27)-N(2))-dimethyltransferase-like [Tubulanus polymorphus]|uniref:tRNA (guanine(27)-N(2))-dimethyltransferase-like n=1 Tax=Tubulanus polymorphus TaxID=672921 RepID=UPI003DA209DE